TQRHRPDGVVEGGVVAVVRAGFLQGAGDFHGQALDELGRTVGNLVHVTRDIGIQRIGGSAGVVVVHADVVGGGVVGLAREVAQAQRAGTAAQEHFALAAPEGAVGRASVD